MVGIGIIGAGYIGRVHAEALEGVPDAELVGFASRRAETAAELAERFGTRAYRSEQELLDDPKVDAVIITYPTHRHLEVTQQAFAAGKHVICEKPIAFSVDEADQMSAAAEESGQLLMLAHVVRFWPGYAELQRQVASGAFGRPIWASGRRAVVRPNWGMWLEGGDRLTGGAVIDLLVHDFDYLNSVFGTPRSVLARGRKDRQDGAIRNVLASVRYDDGDAIVDGSADMPPSAPFTSTVRVFCERGVLDYQFVAGGGRPDEGAKFNTLTIYPADGEAYEPSLDQRSAFLIQAEYFVGCLRDGRSPEIGTVAQARDAIALALAARTSLQEGREVTI